MKKDPAGRPVVGCTSKCLGVRADGPHRDVTPDTEGNVPTDDGGLSVTEGWRTLQPHLIPEELDDGDNGARGKHMAVFVHGTGTFAEVTVTAALVLRFKPDTREAGTVCPAALVPLAQYQNDLAATLPDWTDDPS